ncbi:MAG: DMT family transporter [Thermoleophilaceae bacterium]
MSGSAPPESARGSALAELALIGIAAVWGLTFTMVQDAIAILPTLAFLAYRFAAATAIVAPVFRRGLAALPREGWYAGLVMGVFLTAGYIFQTLGLEHTTPSDAGFITGLFVVLTPVLGAVFLRQRISGVAWAAAGVSALGLYLLSGAGGDFTLRGDGLVFLAAVSFAAHILATGRAAGRFDVGALLVVQLGVAGVACLVLAAAAGDLEAPHGAKVWSALAVTAIFASALGFFVQTYAQQHAPPARTALILASEPAFAGLFGYLLADDRLSAVAWLGAGLIMAAIVAVELRPRWRTTEPLPEQ